MNDGLMTLLRCIVVKISSMEAKLAALEDHIQKDIYDAISAPDDSPAGDDSSTTIYFEQKDREQARLKMCADLFEEMSNSTMTITDMINRIITS